MAEFVFGVILLIIICVAFIVSKDEKVAEITDTVEDKIKDAVEDVKNLAEDLQETAKQLEDKLMKMTKNEIEEYAREFGIELDKRRKKVDMIKEFFDLKDKE